ncbi:hypothetical protein [Streptomyces sp. NPDC008150]|uniref:hypothetical protein n=1 Tax=Streptomyces sp. NPDC008150 TaxID=3364816 RepID=UPI0036EA1C39
MPTYAEIMTTELSALTTAADSWDAMAKKFHTQETAYKRDVFHISMGRGWSGLSADAANRRFAITLNEYKNAQIEAKSVASLLRDAHAQFTNLRGNLKSARQDAVAAGMAVSEEGVVSYDTTKLSDGERNALHHDPDYQRSVSKAVTSWQLHLDRFVQEIGHADAGLKTALGRVVLDGTPDDGTLDGFNGRARGDVKSYEVEAAKEAMARAKEKKGGWQSEIEVSGPGAGASATGPDWSEGSLGEAEAHADLGSAGAKGELANGPMELEGGAEAYAGVKGSISGSVGQDGLSSESSALAGGESSAEGSAYAGPFGVTGKTEALAGLSAAAGAEAGTDGMSASAEAFAGAKGSVSGEADLGGLEAGVMADGYAGPGAEATLGVSKDESGTWRLSTKVGASPGLGGGVGFDLGVNPGKVIKTVGDAASAVGDVIGGIF